MVIPSDKKWIKNQARRLGFDLCGIAGAAPIERGDYLRAWLDAGRAGSMNYLHRHLESRLNPAALLEGTVSAIVVALNYYQAAPATARNVCATHGRVARYAWGRDYHRVIKGKLHQLADALRDRFGSHITTRACVDTAPIIEREAAAMAGIGWIGKNTMVLSTELGSFFVIGVLLTTLEIEPDKPVDDHCGSCTACLDACPTKAFPTAYEMDASRCISFLTIEHRGEIPDEFRESIGDWVFGCDVCQEVCPYNRRPPETTEPDFAIRPPGPALNRTSILDWTQEEYDQQTRGSATRRATLTMWKRNASIAVDQTPCQDSENNR